MNPLYEFSRLRLRGLGVGSHLSKTSNLLQPAVKIHVNSKILTVPNLAELLALGLNLRSYGNARHTSMREWKEDKSWHE